MLFMDHTITGASFFSSGYIKVYSGFAGLNLKVKFFRHILLFIRNVKGVYVPSQFGFFEARVREHRTSDQKCVELQLSEIDVLQPTTYRIYILHVTML